MSSEPLWHWYTEQVDPNERHSFAFTAVHYFGRTQFQSAQIIETEVLSRGV
jgi:spermidine synthase